MRHISMTIPITQVLNAQHDRMTAEERTDLVRSVLGNQADMNALMMR